MRKLIVTLAVLLVIGSFYFYDYHRSLQYNIEVLWVRPDPAEADGITPVQFELLLTDKNGSPVEGHDLFAFPKVAGSNMESRRLRTDSAGKALFTYFPYRANIVEPVYDVPIEIRDESNSVFIEVNTKILLVLKMIDPVSEGIQSEIDFDKMFGEETD